MFRIRDPLRYTAPHPYRRLNPWTMLAEFPWLMCGRSDIRWLLPYLPGAGMFSDNGITWRAGYGPRLRGNGKQFLTDQVGRVMGQLVRDQYTRQAIVSLWYPDEDNVDDSRDYPCTQTLHFMCAPDGHLDLYTHMRSNDLFWGASGVNVPNFCLLLQLVAAATGLEVGDYYHIADNLHVYERHRDHLERTAACTLSSPYRDDWRHPPMGAQALQQLPSAVYAVERFAQRHHEDMTPSGLANWIGAPIDEYAVQWAHFMLLWQLLNDTPRRRVVAKRPGDDALAVRLDLALADVQCRAWRLAAAMWMIRSAEPLNVRLGTQHMRDLLTPDQFQPYLGAVLD
jgi:hypothetical protein